MGSPTRLLIWCLTVTSALEPRNKPQTQACVDDRGDAVECVQPEEEGPGSIQDQFAEHVQTARRLKGLDTSDAPATLSMTQRKNKERKARQTERRRKSGVCPNGGICSATEPFFSPECAPGDAQCLAENRRLAAEQAALREDLQRKLDAEYAKLDAETEAPPNDTAPPPRYYGDTELAAALDGDQAAAWAGEGRPLRAPVHAPRSF